MIFPNRCIVCGKICKDKYFCNNCNGLLKPFSVKLCTKCGSPFKYCECKYRFYYFDKIISVFPNDNNERESFYRYKFNGYLSAGGYFSSLMAKVVKSSFNDTVFDIVTSVPMHISKRLDRGYNQSEVLARKIAKILNIPYKNLLSEPHKSKTQHKLTSIADRYLNVKNKYKLIKNANIKGKSVLLVDDIMTTGATLSECARLLKLGGAEKVYATTALKTINKGNSHSPIEK